MPNLLTHLGLRIYELLQNPPKPKETTLRLIYTIILSVFLAVLVYAVIQFPGNLSSINIYPLIPVLLIFVLFIGLNAHEFSLLAKMQKITVPAKTSLHISSLSSVANFLPLPGGLLLRLSALKKQGGTYKSGFIYNLFSFIILSGIALLIAGSALLVISHTIAGFIHLSIGIVICLSCLVIGSKFICYRNILALFLNRIAIVISDTVRLYLALTSLGVACTIVETATMTTASVAGLAATFMPAGIGIKEGAAALIAAYIELPVLQVFLASALLRLIDISGLCIIFFLYRFNFFKNV